MLRQLVGQPNQLLALLSDLRRTIDAVTTMVVEDDHPDIAANTPPDHAWKVRDRLSPADLDQLVNSFRQGFTIPELVARHRMSFRAAAARSLLGRLGI
jgi:hypothetical protein